MVLNHKNQMHEFTTYIPPGPIQFVYTHYPNEWHYDIQTLIVKPKARDYQLGQGPDLKIRKEKRKFNKEASVFAEFYENTKNDYRHACL